MTHRYDRTDGDLPARIDRHEPTDIELTWGEDDPLPAGRPRVAPDRFTVNSWRAIFAGCTLVAVIFYAGSCTGRVSGIKEAQEAGSRALTAAENSAEQAAESADYWRTRAVDTSATLAAVESDLASMTAEAALWRKRAEESPKVEVIPQSRSTAPQNAAEGAWSAGQVEATLREAAAHYGLDAAATEWIDPVWSCYRFVKVYADGGEAKVRQHWRATV